MDTIKTKARNRTILNTILISIVLDYSYPYMPKPDSYFFQIIQSLFGVFLVGLGSGFYLTANLALDHEMD